MTHILLVSITLHLLNTGILSRKGNHAVGGFMLHTNKNILRVENMPNNRSKKLAWMRENYCWHIIFTDYMANTYPPINYLAPVFSFMKTNFGKSTLRCAQGPPTGATTNA